MTTIYVSTEQAQSVNRAIEIFRKDGYQISSKDLTVFDNGELIESYIEIGKDIDPKFLFKLAFKAGFLLQ